ncbi:RBBP9/YdeN family alpha/beta hydrolase [Demequina soli]|uniref:RBBP9/YdeN family alpha/beta hydrolase n=1 Tax=Demequina soli TaxID=1638987 RepID=UPI00078395A1|nr:alpha/beta hydrolase [Demequina soli]
MTARVLLLHGYQHLRPRDHWMWWLAEELRARRVPVQYPQLPAPGDPVLRDWSAVAAGELEMLGGGERIVIAHSLGTVLWRHLEAHGAAADRVLLVAPPGPERLGAIGDFAAAASATLRDGATMVARERDPYRDGPLEAIADRWGAPGVVLPGAGHLNVDDGHGAWPSLLGWTLTGETEWRLGEGARSLDA